MKNHKVHLDIVQYSDEWWKLRLGRITGSSISDILAKGKGKTRMSRLYKIAAERLTKERCDSDIIFTNRHLERGHEQEEDARMAYEMSHYNTIQEVGFISVGDNIGFSPDGRLNTGGLIEIKNKDNHTFLEQKMNGIKGIEKAYLDQMQFGLWITGEKFYDYICYNKNFKPLVIRIEPDEEKFKEIEEAIELAEKDIKEIMDKCR